MTQTFSSNLKLCEIHENTWVCFWQTWDLDHMFFVSLSPYVRVHISHAKEGNWLDGGKGPPPNTHHRAGGTVNIIGPSEVRATAEQT